MINLGSSLSWVGRTTNAVKAATRPSTPKLPSSCLIHRNFHLLSLPVPPTRRTKPSGLAATPSHPLNTLNFSTQNKMVGTSLSGKPDVKTFFEPVVRFLQQCCVSKFHRRPGQKAAWKLIIYIQFSAFATSGALLVAKIDLSSSLPSGFQVANWARRQLVSTLSLILQQRRLSLSTRCWTLKLSVPVPKSQPSRPMKCSNTSRTMAWKLK